MSSRFSHGVKRAIRFVAIGCTSIALQVSAYGQTNTWINSISGKWEDASSWSLGTAPGIGDASDLITNAGNSTVTNDATTAGSFPATMVISNLTVSAPNGSTNTLVLSNLGTITPLVVHNSVMIGSGGILLMTNSLLSSDGATDGALSLDSSATLYDSSLLLNTNVAMTVGSVGTGMLLAGGGTNVLSGDVYVGYSTNSVGSVVLATGQLVMSNGNVAVGFYGSGQIIVSNGLLSSVTFSNNTSLGTNIPPTGMLMGVNASANGTLAVLGGTCLEIGHLGLGEESGSTGLVWVSNGRLIVTNGYLISIGGNGVGQMVVSNSQMSAYSVGVANGPASQGTLTIAGGTGSFSGGLIVGIGLGATGSVSVTSGQLTVSNQTIMVGSYGVGQMTVSNSSLLARAIRVGNSSSSSGTLTFAGSTTATVSNIVAGSYSNSTGVIQLTGGSLGVTNQSGTALLAVGLQGNGQLIQSDGTLNVDYLSVAAGLATTFSDPNGSTGVVIKVYGIGQMTLSNGTVLARTLEVAGGVQSQGTLTVAAGTMSVSSNMVAGSLSNGVGRIQIGGGIVTVTNQLGTGKLVIGQVGQGILTQNGGSLTVDHLFVINGTNSQFNLNAGSLGSKSTTVSNTQTFVVGDGVDATTFRLLGGVHTFANGLRVRSNATLAGCGTINGSVLVDAGGTITSTCGAGTTLTFTGILTNNGVLLAVNGGTLEFYSPVVNNGLINALAGHANFHAGLVNNGVALTSDTIPQIVSISVVGSDVNVQFTTFSNLTHYVEYNSNLVNGSWIALTGFTGTGGIMSHTDPGAATLTQRFYRVHMVVPQ